MNHASEILLLGAAHLDRNGRCAEQPMPGRSTPGRVTTMPGGAAFNVASNLAALGSRVQMQSIVGEDAEADILRRTAVERNIRLTLQTTAEHQTASYTAIVAPDGDLVAALADMAVYARFEALAALPLVKARKPTDWLLIDANLPAAVIERLFSAAACRKVAMSVSAAKASRLRPSLRAIDLLFANRAELAALCGCDPTVAMDRLFQALEALGGGDAIVSDGANDLWTIQNGSVRRYDVPEISSVVDVIGAGDALTAGCLSALMTGRPLEAAVHNGIRAAQAILAVKGPWRADLSAALNASQKD